MFGLDQESLDQTWEWIRESPEEWKLEDGVLKLRTQQGRIWAGPKWEGGVSKNLLVAKKHLGESAEAVTDIELVDAVNKWEQCGLLVYTNDDAFVKFIVEYIEGGHFVVMAWELGKKRKVVAKIPITSNRAQLRLMVDGDTVHGFWRLTDEKTWHEAATCKFPVEPARRFGIFSQGGLREQKRWAFVRDLEWKSISK